MILSGATTLNPSGTGSNINERGHPHFPKLQKSSLAMRWFNVISWTLVGVLPLRRNEAGVFYSPRLNQIIQIDDVS